MLPAVTSLIIAAFSDSHGSKGPEGRVARGDELFVDLSDHTRNTDNGHDVPLHTLSESRLWFESWRESLSMG